MNDQKPIKTITLRLTPKLLANVEQYQNDTGHKTMSGAFSDSMSRAKEQTELIAELRDLLQSEREKTQVLTQTLVSAKLACRQVLETVTQEDLFSD